MGINAVFLEPGRISGTATYTWSLIEALSTDERLDLVVYAQDGWVPDRVRALPIRVERCPTGFRWVGSRVAWEQLRLPGRVRRDGIDVLFSTAYVSPLIGRFAKIVTVHDLYYRKMPEAVPVVRRTYYRIFIAASVRRCERVIVLSENTRNDLVDAIPSSAARTIVAPSATRPDLLDAAPESPDVARPYFLVVASITANKNIDAVVRAATRLRDDGVDVRVCVVGEDPYGLLARAIDRHRANDVVEFVGEVDNGVLAGFYRDAVAVIHPSIYEGFGLPVLEAQTLGVPLISSRGGALREVAGDGALFFDHDNPQQLVEAMVALLEDEGLRRDLIERGRTNAARYTWESTASATAEGLLEAWHVRHGSGA